MSGLEKLDQKEGRPGYQGRTLYQDLENVLR